MGPLTGLKVVELGTYVAVPKAARMMADWGADVIKVEAPGGEDWRTMGRNWEMPYTEDNNPIMQTENANKRDICINLKNEDGKKAFFKLLETADIFLTNTRGKGLVKLGIDYESIKDRYPRLIYAHLTGLGEFGPDKDRPGFDVTAFWARSSALIQWANKEYPPCKPHPGVGDGATGHALLAGVLAALYQREKTGKGDKVNISLFGTALWCNSSGVVMGQPQYGLHYPKSIYEVGDAFYPLYKTADERWILMSTPWEASLKKVLGALDIPQYAEDPRFMTLAESRKHLREIIPIMQEAFLKKESAEIFERLTAEGVAFEMLAAPDEAYKDEQAWANGYLREVELECGEKVVLPLTPVQFASHGAEDIPYKLSPHVGEQSNAILEELGYSEEEIRQFNESNAVIQHD